MIYCLGSRTKIIGILRKKIKIVSETVQARRDICHVSPVVVGQNRKLDFSILYSVTAGQNRVQQDPLPRKKPFTPRDNEGYDTRASLESEWHRRYVRFPNQPLSKKNLKLFRRRFRMPHDAFQNLVHEARDDNWFPNYEKCLRNNFKFFLLKG